MGVDWLSSAESAIITFDAARVRHSCAANRGLADMSEADVTRDQGRIKEWAEARGGRPSIVKDTANNGKPGALLRFDFGKKDDSLDEIDWPKFFDMMDKYGLALLLQETTKSGNKSRFCKFVDAADHGLEKAPAKKRASAKSASAAKPAAKTSASSKAAPASKSSAAKPKATKAAASKTSASAGSKMNGAKAPASGSKSTSKSAAKPSAPAKKTSASKAASSTSASAKSPAKTASKSSAGTAASKKTTTKASSSASASSKSTANAKPAAKSASSAKAATPKKAAASGKAATASKSKAAPSAKSASSAKASPAAKSTKAPAKKAKADAAAGEARLKKASADDDAQTTVDHTRIREWVESRGGRPTHVAETGTKKGKLGILRIDFGKPDEGLAAVPWPKFLKAFDDNKLAFLFKEKTATGKVSRFNKFVSRDDA
ncbi:hypothetical protein RDV64_12245 [Acuticoccus sp. MNP-M23]|uniref:hypothetical protein n=1 Tax=Acuticoccus sp. MNP-M23 TaxID=3072793 RepID=UPI0028153906|nr:hypothetical protein [Acuticoccus sp. MNP-M23]WMS40866.1 hypothetical protein RDV64_12245 [Acuticoccus sp. MNP-M23]